jgi:hypothetical protein
VVKRKDAVSCLVVGICEAVGRWHFAFAVDGFVAEIRCLPDTNDRFISYQMYDLGHSPSSKAIPRVFRRVFLPNYRTSLPPLLAILTGAINRAFGRSNRARQAVNFQFVTSKLFVPLFLASVTGYKRRNGPQRIKCVPYGDYIQF